MKLANKKRGFTLMEILVAVSVFAVVIVTSTTVYINIAREYKRSNLHNAIYEDSRLLMEKITSLGRQYTIDYEEYYSQLVVQKGLTDRVYGINYGVYGSRFYDPGLTITTGSPNQGVYPNNLGAECGNGDSILDNDGLQKDCVIYIPSLDNNTGKNPYNNDPNWAAAVCNGDCDSPLAKQSLQNELYLISSDGTRKVIFVLEKVSRDGEKALAMVELVGTDTDNNGVVDTYTCDTEKGYECTQNGLPSYKDLTDTNDLINGNKLDFVPVSSLNTQVAQLNFLIAPLEDPLKAFNEKESYIQMGPHFTIVLTVEPNQAARSQINFGDVPAVTLQTSVTPRVDTEVKSYPPLKNIDQFKATLPNL